MRRATIEDQDNLAVAWAFFMSKYNHCAVTFEQGLSFIMAHMNIGCFFFVLVDGQGFFHGLVECILIEDVVPPYRRGAVPYIFVADLLRPAGEQMLLRQVRRWISDYQLEGLDVYTHPGSEWHKTLLASGYTEDIVVMQRRYTPCQPHS